MGKIAWHMVLLAALAACFGACDRGPSAQEAARIAERIEVPDGFESRVFPEDVPNARSMTLSKNGVVYVGTRRLDRVYAMRDADGDGRADRVHVIATGLNTPNGVAWRDGSLYVAEISRVLRFDGIDERLDDPPQPVVVSDSFPTDKWHGWKFIAFGPDGLLYVPVGAPCNVCDPPDKRYASIMRMKPDGTGLEVFAHGVRNTVGFDWHPETKELWFTDNGRDWLGDNSPPDELNRAPRGDMDFGFPHVHGKDTLDPEFGEGHRPDDFTPPERELGPHVAALGMRFYTGEMFPREYSGAIFIAEHGSWNRSEKIGYRVMLVRLREDAETTYEPFATGWLTPEGKVLGRPVDVLVMPDGALLVSDDAAGTIYRVSHRGDRGAR